MAQEVFLELIGTRRRVDRYRYPAGQQNAKKTEKIVPPRRQHDRYAIACVQSAVTKPGGNSARVAQPVGKTDRLWRFAIFVQIYRGAFGLFLRIPDEHFIQCLRVFGNSDASRIFLLAL